MVTNLDQNRDVDGDSPSNGLLDVDPPEADDRTALVARVLLESFGGRAMYEYGPAATAVGARRITRRRTGGEPPALEDACARISLDVPRVANAENCLLEAISPPTDPGEVDRLSARVEHCRQVLVATARDRAGPPRLTTVLCGRGTSDDPDPEDVTVPDHVDPLPPAANVEQLKAHYHRPQSDLRCARLGVELYEQVTEAELTRPTP
jgi:hypothetical protein